MSTIPVIDLFAGPGGLGEGFASQRDKFHIAVSIEKEASAHRTLLLRAFFRQFDEVPPAYYDFLKNKLGEKPEDQLYKLFPEQFAAAQKEARCLTLGENGNKEIFAAIDAAVGNSESILIGGPPCQAYSLVGRARNRGIAGYRPEQDHRNFLYQDYLQVIARYQPQIFVMENVKGMLSAKVGGNAIFGQILQDLQNPARATRTRPAYGRKPGDYQVIPVAQSEHSNDLFQTPDTSSFVVRAEKYGVPQERHRVILLGIRGDLADKWRNSFGLEQQKPVSLESVIRDLPALRSGFSKQENTSAQWLEYLESKAPKLAKSLRSTGLEEVAEAFDNFPDRLKEHRNQQGLNLGLRKSGRRAPNCNKELRDWYIDDRMENHVVNHVSRGHMATDLDRYLFCSLWGEIARREGWENPFPKSADYPDAFKPAHRNFNSGKFADRFRVQTAHTPAKTITSHISKDGHYFIHYDPTQCRSFTVREAARVQTFPDNYFFVGNRTQQFVQVGNAVPPWLAKQIAKSISRLLS